MNVSRQDDILVVTMTTSEASDIMVDLEVGVEYDTLEWGSQLFIEWMHRKGVE